MIKGSRHSEESKQKNRLAHIGKKFTASQKAHVITANRVINSNIGVRYKKRISCEKFYKSVDGIALREKWSQERKNNSNALGYCHTQDAKDRMSLHRTKYKKRLGIQMPYELRLKLSKIMKERKWDKVESQEEKRVRVLKRQKDRRDKRKVDVLTHYGNGTLACVKCGYNDIRALSIDHINGEGFKHRGRIRRELYLWLEKNKYPTGFQTLCMNCQYIKRVEKKEYRREDSPANQFAILTKG